MQRVSSIKIFSLYFFFFSVCFLLHCSNQMDLLIPLSTISLQTCEQVCHHYLYLIFFFLRPHCSQIGGIYEHPVTGELVTVQAIPGASDRFKDTWAIIVTVLACIGAVVSFGLFIYLLVMYPVRGGTSILGFMLSFGIVMLYLTVLAFVAHADRQICGLRRFALGFVYSFVYASLLVKLVDCWRVRGKDEAYPAKYSKLGRPLGLFLVTFFLVLVQVRSQVFFFLCFCFLVLLMPFYF